MTITNLQTHDENGIELPKHYPDGKEMPRPSGLRYWQEVVFTNPARMRVATCGRRCGKLFSPDTDILTVNRGWIQFGDIKIGDSVFDENGNPCNVTNVYKPAKENSGKMYSLSFESGEDLKTCGDHQWITWTHRDRKQFARKDVATVQNNGDFPPKDWPTFEGKIYDRQGKPCDTYGPKQRSTQDIVDTFKIGSRGDNNHSIPVCDSLEFVHKELPIDPYLFGYFLGDGTVDSGLFTISPADQPHFLAHVKKLGYKVTFRKDKLSVYLLGFMQQLREHGLARKDNIPDEYKFCSQEQRLALLQGLMDSDGYNGGKVIEFCAKRKQHADLVHYLLVSLGQKATISTKMSKLYGKECGLVYRVFSSPSINIFSLSRKREKFSYDDKTARRMRQKHRMLTGYKEIDWIEGSLCITVDSPNHMYLIGKNLIPTHNTIMALNELIRAAQAGYKQTVWYVAPTYRQAKSILWTFLKDAIPKENILKKDEQDLTITLKGYESTISLKGADNAESLRGAGLSFLVVDEVQDINIDVIDTILRPAMADNEADGLFIGTPKGMGKNTMHILYFEGKKKKNWKTWTYTTEQGGNVATAEIEASKSVMSSTKFKQEFLASFEAAQGRVFYNFCPIDSIRDDIQDTGGELLVGMDFNVSKMTACVGVRAGDELHIIDEFVIENANTQLMCTEINRRYPNRKITCYPDPSGVARKTSAEVGQTDFAIIRSFGFGLIAHKKAPLVVDSINDVNAMLLNAAGRRRLYVRPECEEVINCLDGLLYKEGTSQPDKDSGHDHMTDALRYIISNDFSLIKKNVRLFTLDTIY